MVKLRYRYGSSIDDILMDESLSDSFEELAHQIAPSTSSRDLRLRAVYIRKNRVFEKDDREKLNALDIAMLEGAWKGAVSLSKVKVLTVTDFGGLDVGIPQAMRRSIDFAANSHGIGAG